MLKKFSLILSVTAALGLGIVVSADAKGHGGGHRGGHHGGGHHGGRHHGGGHGGAHVNRSVHVRTSGVHVTRDARVHGNRPANKRYVVGRAYDGHIWFGHRRHFWHGRWYAYGVGPCWIYIDGLWFWNPVVCPL
jgi:hypothetical protein